MDTILRELSELAAIMETDNLLREAEAYHNAFVRLAASDEANEEEEAREEDASAP